jgi:hypothetical protein
MSKSNKDQIEEVKRQRIEKQARMRQKREEWKNPIYLKNVVLYREDGVLIGKIEQMDRNFFRAMRSGVRYSDYKICNDKSTIDGVSISDYTFEK